MSTEETKRQLLNLLDDADSKVIALSGKWGTGKSHLWNQIKSESGDPSVTGSLYASLFGAKSMDQVKMKLIQSSVSKANEYPAAFSAGVQAIKTGLKALQGMHGGFSALNDLGLIAAPMLLKGRILVLDDIERRHADLSIEEVLGFIDEFTKRHESRVLLILNDDKLHQREVWETLREKVIDQEIRLIISSSEAYEIAAGIAGKHYEPYVRPTLERCEVTNIRVILRTIRAVTTILPVKHKVDEPILARTVPSIVFLAVIHYRGMDSAPDFDFVLAQGGAGDWRLERQDGDKSETNATKDRWKALMDDLRIVECDDFEMLVAEYLQSGLYDKSKLESVIARYVGEQELLFVRSMAGKFQENCFWNHKMTDERLLEMASQVVDRADLLDPYAVTSFHDQLLKLEGGRDMADKSISIWLASFKKNPPQELSLDNVFNQSVHPLVQAAFEEVNAVAQRETSILDAVKHIYRSSGWGIRQEVALRSSTTADMKSVVLSSSVEDLKIFLRKMVEFNRSKESYVRHFGPAMDNFTEACREIVVAEPEGRLAGLLRQTVPGLSDQDLAN